MAAVGENWTESVQDAPAATIVPVQASVPDTTEKFELENAATGESALLDEVNGNTLDTPIYIGIVESFVRDTAIALDVLPKATLVAKLMVLGLTTMLPALVGAAPGA